MSMEIAGNYTKYETAPAGKATASAGKAAAGSGRVSDAAKDYLDGLKQRYPGVDISVVDFKSEKQKLSYMMGSSGLQNLAISGRIIEKMARDPATAEKYEGLIAKMPEDARETQKWADENNAIVHGSGMVIDKNGKVTYWMVAGDKEPRENPGSAYKKQQQKLLEEKRADRKKNDATEKRRAGAKKQEEALEKKRITMAETRKKLLENPKKAAGDGKGKTIDLSV